MGDRTFDIALALSGGNALGAYQAGAYQALHAAGLEPDRVAGASAGALNGAIICGNVPSRRVAQLDALWRPAPRGTEPHPWEEARRTLAAAWTLAGGEPRLFVPRHLFGPWWNPLGSGEPSSLYDARPLGETIARLIDVDLLNGGHPRFAATAIDVETGEDVVFDTAHGAVTVDAVRASGALFPAFAPVEVGGRLLGDAGISANLPLDTILAAPGERPLLCLAIDLLPLAAPRPRDLGETVLRAQDLVFAAQSRRTLAAWQAIDAARGGERPAVTVVHLAYRDQRREVSGKAFDFSPASIAERWRAGAADMARVIDALSAGEVAIGAPGLTVLAPAADGTLAPVRHALAPAPFVPACVAGGAC